MGLFVVDIVLDAKVTNSSNDETSKGFKRTGNYCWKLIIAGVQLVRIRTGAIRA